MDAYFHDIPDFQDLSTTEDVTNFFYGEEIGLNELSPENVTPTYFATPVVWRSAAAMEAEPYLIGSFGGPRDYPLERPLLTKQQQPKVHDGVKISPTKLPANSFGRVPEVPILLMTATSFESNQEASGVCAAIEEALQEGTGLSYECNPKNYEWNAFLAQGSCCCKFEVHVYSKSEGILVIEANRLSGDSKLFRSFYCQLKNKVLDCPCRSGSSSEPASFLAKPGLSHSSSANFSSSLAAAPLGGAVVAAAVEKGPYEAAEEESNNNNSSSSLRREDQPQHHHYVADGELDHASVLTMLKPILQMASEKYREAQLEGARLLCELSMDESMPPILCEGGCIPILRDILNNTVCDWARLAAISTLANLSDSTICQEKLVNGGVLPVLFQLAVDDTYQTAELRRLAAYILANLSKRLSNLFVKAVAPEQVRRWVESVDGLRDAKLKLQALRAKEHLLHLF